MLRLLHAHLLTAAALVLALATPARADELEPEHFRGRITAVQGSAIAIRTSAGKTVRLYLADDTRVFGLSRASFADVTLNSYVGAVVTRLRDEAASPTARDSEVWLHRALELRLIDEALRGISLGSRPWDRVPGSTVSHGWVDDIELRVLSIKWGPTDYDEVDVDIPPEVPVHKMSPADRSLVTRGAHVFAGARKGAGGRYQAIFVFIGRDGVVPAL